MLLQCFCAWMWKGGKEMSPLKLRETFRRCGQGCWFGLIQLKEAGLALMDGMDFLELIPKDKHNYQNCSLPINYLRGVWFPRMEDLLCQKFQKYQNKPNKPTNSEQQGKQTCHN